VVLVFRKDGPFIINFTIREPYSFHNEKCTVVFEVLPSRKYPQKKGVENEPRRASTRFKLTWINFLINVYSAAGC
jgi:hypothetical protein